MATYNLKEFCTNIANAIRNKLGITDKINAQDFAAMIESIVTNEGINGVTVEDGELFINNDVVGAAQVNVEGDAVYAYLALNDSDIDLSGCTGDTHIYNTGNAAINTDNLTPENIKAGVSILGHEGTYEGGLEGIAFNGTNVLEIDNDTYRYIYIKHSAETQIEYSGYLILKANVYIRSIQEGCSVTATNLTPANIKKGVTILGVTGTYEG